MSRRDLFRKILLPCLILALGAGVTIGMLKMRQSPQPEAQEFVGPLVDVVAVAEETRRVEVVGTGTVQARQQAGLTPQVSGRVDWLAPQLVAGGFFQKGEPLFTIEAVDYRLVLERAQASLVQAELDLLRIESQAKIARDEWLRLEMETDSAPNPLVLYEPQLKSAKAAVASARAAVEQAEIDLARTTLKAPFDCYVRDEQVDIGQYLRAGNSVGTLVGTDRFEVVVPLPLEDLAWLDVPTRDAGERGSAARVQLKFGERQLSWEGEVVRILGDVDPRNRMVSLVVAVDEPFRQSQTIELAPGMFVEVVLLGKQLAQVVPLPRGALRDHDTVWVVDERNRLQIRPIDILRRERHEVLVKSGLSAGERIVLGGLTGAADGMLLRPQLVEDVE